MSSTKASEQIQFVANWLRLTPLWRLEPDDLTTMAATLEAIRDDVASLEAKRDAHLHGIAHGQTPYVAGPECDATPGA